MIETKILNTLVVMIPPRRAGLNVWWEMAIYNTTSAYKLLDDDDIFLHLLISKCVTSLTRNQRVKFDFILEMIRHNVTKKEI